MNPEIPEITRGKDEKLRTAAKKKREHSKILMFEINFFKNLKLIHLILVAPHQSGMMWLRALN